MSKFDPVVWDAAEVGDIDTLVSALTLHPYLIDAPHFRERRQTPMFIAAQNGHVGIVSKLVELGSRAIDTPDKYGWTPMYAAALNGDVSVVETLVRLGSQAIDTPNYNGWTPMFAAAFNGHVSAIETLVRLGSTAIDTPNNSGWTPVYAAAMYECFDCVNILKMLGADCDRTSSLKMTNETVELLKTKVDEDESLSTRYNVYFRQSFSSRLLFKVEKQK